MPDILSAPAKVNLSLAITGRRPDGYHELESLFIPVPGLADTLEIDHGAPGTGCAITPELPGTPTERNLIFKAWQAFGQATGFAPDVRIALCKRIPTGAGLGGGSSDAAAMLLWLQGQAGEKALSTAALNALAARLGADVPFFLAGGAALARGIGERLTLVDPGLDGLILVLALPEVHVPTAWAYAAWDSLADMKNTASARQDCLTTRGSTNKRRVSLSPVVVFNDFEDVVFPAHPSLRTIKERLLGLGAIGAVMSGSGAGIAALYRSERLASDAAQALRSEGVNVHIETQGHWGVAKR